MASSNRLLYYSFTTNHNTPIGSQFFEYNSSPQQSILPPPPPLNIRFSGIKERKSLSILEFENTFPQPNNVTNFIPVNHVSMERQPVYKVENFRPPSIHQSFVHSVEYFPYNSTKNAATANIDITPLHIQNAPKGAGFELQRGQPLRALNAQSCKKTVKWNDEINKVYLMHSPDDYDRKIDNETIRTNTEQKRSYLLMKMYPKLRKEEIFQQLCSLDFERF